MIRAGRAAAVAASVLVALAACAPPPPPSSPAPEHYERVDDLCTYVDLNAVNAILPYVADESMPYATGNQRFCSFPGDGHGIVGTLLEVFADDGRAEEHFSRYYDLSIGMPSGAEMTGIGERAFRFVSPTGAPVVRVLDNNAVISADWFGFQTEDVDLLDSFDVLTEIARYVMASLQDA